MPSSAPPLQARQPWRVASTDRGPAQALAKALQLEPFVAQVLLQRGIHTVEQARRFLEPSVDHLQDPFLMADMDRAADRVARAVRDREGVLVYGDYDVDGLSATALLVHFLRFLGVEPQVYIPNRAYGGYSFTPEGVRAVLEGGARVVISVDNGTSSVERIGELQDTGVDVIVTDHHMPGPELPPAHALLNPHRHDCPYPFKELAGVGVAFKLACGVAHALREGKKRSPDMMRFLGAAMGWVALGTVADMVPLRGENRVLVARGLPAIPRSPSPGLAALCAQAKVRTDTFSAEDISFRIAPRINAAGRLGQAEVALQLLTTDDTGRANALAAQLDALNRRRRAVDREMFGGIEPLLMDLAPEDPVVLANDSWTTGLLGLVAQRVVRATGRPAVLISRNEDNATAKGSARSVPGFDVQAALAHCGEYLDHHGGHAAAAGFSIRPERIDAFREAFTDLWRRSGAQPAPLAVDGELPLGAVSARLVSQIERLEPCGQGNPRPVLGTMGVSVESFRRMGDGTHLELKLAQGAASLRAVAFGRGELADQLQPGTVLDVLFRPRVGRFAARGGVELELVDLRATDRAPAHRAGPEP